MNQGTAGTLTVHPSQRDGCLRALRVAFEQAPVGMALTDQDGRLQVVNSALSNLLGLDASDLLGRRLCDLTSPLDQRNASDTYAALLHEGSTTKRTELRMLHADGTPVHTLVSGARICDEGGRLTNLVLHIDNISEYKRVQDLLWHQAMHDPLTGLPNRALLRQRLSEALVHREPEEVLTVLAVDLDGFKDVNDRYGHRVGDDLLRALGARMVAAVRPADTVARTGGDEFVLLCPRTGAEMADTLVMRVEETIRQPFMLAGQLVHIDASVGAATASGADDPVLDDLLEQADSGMYAVKRRHSGRRISSRG
jgi:diguanylate cyclase (GGDEF)-like protein/PAS domain S-box-containing protein